jgi:hypothetical protein
MTGEITSNSAIVQTRLTAVDHNVDVADLQPQQYEGQRDLCHIMPGVLSLSDRSLMPVALAPLPMPAGYGRKDAGSHQEHAANFRTICAAQYQALSASAIYS